jgi:hypothetical protein
MTLAGFIAGLFLALTLPHVFDATTLGGTPLFPWSHHAWFKVAAASRRCSLSEQRRDASATFRTAILAGKWLNFEHPTTLIRSRFAKVDESELR